MKTVKIILTTIGANAGPAYNIYDNADGFTTVRCGPILITEFYAPDGYDCTQIDDSATIIHLVEVGGICETTLELNITECTTTTTTSSTTTSSTSTTTTSTSSTTTTTTTAECLGDLYDCYLYDIYCTGGEGTSTTFTVVDCEDGAIGQITVYDGSPWYDYCYRVDPVYLSGSESYTANKKTPCGEYCVTTTSTTTLPT